MRHKTKEQLIAFETRIRDLFAQGQLPFLLHLCGGNEDQLIDIFKRIQPGDWIFSSHRSHYHYLLAGGSEARLEDLIRNGQSMFIFDRQLNFVTSSIVAGTCAIAAGVAQALKLNQEAKHVWCFIGDAGEDEGHFYEAVRWVNGHMLPCTFVIEDNNRSVDTTKIQRHGLDHSLIPWLSCIMRYSYEPTYPHAGAGLKQMITFDPAIVTRFSTQ